MLLCASNKDEKFRSLQSKWHTKTYLSIIFYFLWILLTFTHPYMAFAMYVFVTLMWLIPSKTIEILIGNDE
jgi:integral membrane sensor domain MASE1